MPKTGPKVAQSDASELTENEEENNFELKEI